jgi:hypothetical protein
MLKQVIRGISIVLEMVNWITQFLEAMFQNDKRCRCWRIRLTLEITGDRCGFW